MLVVDFFPTKIKYKIKYHVKLWKKYLVFIQEGKGIPISF